MRLFFVLLAVLLSTVINLSAKNQLTVAFNLNECPTCYDNLNNLRLIDTNTDLIFVFDQQYQSDSSQLVNRYGLEKYQARYIWSDSLNRKLRIKHLLSTVVFSNSNNSYSYSIPLKNIFTREIASYFNDLAQPIDTIDLQGNYISSGVRYPIIPKAFNLYFINDFNNDIECVDMLTGKRTLQIPIGDKLERSAFQKAFPKQHEEYYNISKAIIRKMGIIKYRMCQKIALSENGNINALNQYTYFKILGQDTIRLPLCVLQVFNTNGELLRTNPIKQITPLYSKYARLFSKGKIEDDTTLYYFATSSLSVTDSIISLDMIAFPNSGFDKGKPKGKRYFRGNFVMDKNGDYIFKSFYPDTLPDVYKDYGYNFENLIYSYDNNNFMFPLFDQIYFANQPGKKIDLNIYSGIQYEGNNLEYNMSVGPANIDGSIAYVFYWLKRNNQSYYIKYYIDSGKKIIKAIDLKNIPKKFIKYLQPDQFDFNYILIPIAENKILRYKVF